MRTRYGYFARFSILAGGRFSPETRFRRRASIESPLDFKRNRVRPSQQTTCSFSPSTFWSSESNDTKPETAAWHSAIGPAQSARESVLCAISLVQTDRNQFAILCSDSLPEIIVRDIMADWRSSFSRFTGHQAVWMACWVYLLVFIRHPCPRCIDCCRCEAGADKSVLVSIFRLCTRLHIHCGFITSRPIIDILNFFIPVV